MKYFLYYFDVKSEALVPCMSWMRNHFIMRIHDIIGMNFLPRQGDNSRGAVIALRLRQMLNKVDIIALDRLNLVTIGPDK